MIKKRRAFVVGIKSLKLSNSEKFFLNKYKPWGVILFLRNIKTIKQAKNLTDSIRKIFKDKNYPILIDQEGGRVNRLSNIISFDNLTSKYFGDLYEKDKMKLNIIYKLFIDNYNFEYSSDEIKILKKISEWPKCIDSASTKLEPHRIPIYLYELAAEFHSYWNLGKQFPEKRFINDQKSISPDKLIFLKAIANVVKSGMDIVGVDSPTKM